MIIIIITFQIGKLHVRIQTLGNYVGAMCKAPLPYAQSANIKYNINNIKHTYEVRRGGLPNCLKAAFEVQRSPDILLNNTLPSCKY